MKLKVLPTIAATFTFLAVQSNAQTYDTNGVVVQTFAGSGFSGYLDGLGQQTTRHDQLGDTGDLASDFKSLPLD